MNPIVTRLLEGVAKSLMLVYITYAPDLIVSKIAVVLPASGPVRLALLLDRAFHENLGVAARQDFQVNQTFQEMPQLTEIAWLRNLAFADDEKT
jgi:hypothetical protein